MVVDAYFKILSLDPGIYSIISTTSHTVTIDQDVKPKRISWDLASLSLNNVQPQNCMIDKYQQSTSSNSLNRNPMDVNDSPGTGVDELSSPREYTVNNILKHVGNDCQQKYILRVRIYVKKRHDTTTQTRPSLLYQPLLEVKKRIPQNTSKGKTKHFMI